MGRVQAPSASRCFQPPEKLARELALAARKAEPIDHGARRRARIGKAVETRDEFQVLRDGEVLIQAEMLGHVADVALDLVGFAANVVAETGAASLVGSEQPAEHADGCGLARAVGAEEAVDLPASHLHGEIAHNLAPVEGFGQPFDLDRNLRCRRHCRSPRTTLTGWPTRSRSGRSAVRASMRKTSFERSSRL